MNERALTFSRGGTIEKPSNSYIRVSNPLSESPSQNSEGSIAIEDALQLTPVEFNVTKNNFDVLNSMNRVPSSINYYGRNSLLPVDLFDSAAQKPKSSLLQPEVGSGSYSSNASIPYFPVSPKVGSSKSNPGVGSQRRQSKFFTLAPEPKDPSLPSLLTPVKTEQKEQRLTTGASPRPSKFQFSQINVEEDEKLEEERPADPIVSLPERKPRPSMMGMMSALRMRRNSKRGSRESVKILNHWQMNLIDDKVSNYADHKHKNILSSAADRLKPRKSKLLDKISLIAARGPSIDDPKSDNPAAIFKQVLKKVNPNSLHKAEKNLRRRFLIRIKKKFYSIIRAPLQIFSPEDSFSLVWNIFIPFMLSFDTFFTPFMISFYGDDRFHDFLNFAVLITPIFFSIDIFINFRTAFYDKGVLITDSSTIVRHYLREGFFVDFITVITDFISALYMDTPGWYVKFLSFIRLKKLWDIITRSEDFLIMSRVTHAILKLLKLWGGIIIVAHWLACIFHMVAYQRRNKEFTWLHDNNLIEAPIFNRYVTAFYWSITTMVTVGYGDVVPVSEAERIYVVIAMIIASVLFGYSMNTVGDIIREMNYEKDQRREKIRSVRKYMNQKNLGKNIQIRVKNYLQYMIESRMLYKHDDEEFFELLSQNLKDEIVTEVNGKILAESKLFSINFTAKAAARLATYMKEMFASPEEVIYDEGDDQDHSIYFIVYGKIQIDYKVKKVKMLEKGETFGELSFFSGQPRSARAKSLFFTNLYSLKRDITMDKLKALPSDFEMFHLIKDNINLYKDYSQLQVTCYSCDQPGHIARNCPEIHYTPDREEIMRDYLKRQYMFKRKYKRSKRPKFNARGNLVAINEIAEMIQEDYNDYTVSDEDLSQDSLDIILERNLILVPGAEMNDLKTRRADRKRKSARLSANLLYEEVANVNEIIGRRGSQMLSQNMLRDESMIDPMNLKSANGEFIFFSIDKVENFELYYPQNNVIKQITEFEKQRFEQLLESRQGVAKALVIRNFGSMLKSNRGPQKSPLFYANLTKDKIIRGRKKTNVVADKQMHMQRLKTLMENALHVKRKNKRRNTKKTGRFGDGEDRKRDHSKTNSDYSDENVASPALKQEEIVDDQDEALIPRKDERKQTNPSAYMNKLNSYNPQMTFKTFSDVQKVTSRTSLMDSPIRRSFQKEGEEEKDKPASQNDTGAQGSKEVKNTVLDAVLKRVAGSSGQDTQSHRKRSSRCHSQGRLEDMQKLIDKIDPDLIQKMVDAKLTKGDTAHFGS